MPKRAFVPSDTGPALALPPPPEQGLLPCRPDAEEQTPGEPVGEPRVPGAAELTDDRIVRRRSDRPTAGWRRVLHTVSGGVINPGIGSVERRRQNLTLRIRRELGCPHKIAVTSIKGGVGKTTVAALLGLTLAEHRGDRVVALDANPDAGTLADRLTGEPGVTVRDLLDHIDGVDALPDVARFTSLAGRLQVLASEQDPARSEAFHRAEYEQVCAVLTRFYNIVITDSGTGMVHSAMDGTLAEADSLVVVGALTLDSASRASKTLDWLVAHGHRDLVARAVVVLSADRTSTELDTARLRSHFSARCRAVVDVPHDPHLATGGRIDMGALRPATADAILELTALVADEFGRSPTPRLP
jgi:MinD-like ATPase involved in chromosome partitioning or flagellar assembly